jgi:hypothetical protein
MGGHEITVSCTRIRGLGTTASYVDVFERSWSAFFASLNRQNRARRISERKNGKCMIDMEFLEK